MNDILAVAANSYTTAVLYETDSSNSTVQS